jgi:1,2-dihydroxy-3-keto-5-methylthiopentene dioxygenase
MASIRIHNTDLHITDAHAVASFLDNQGVLYEQWDASKLPEHIDTFVLDDDQKKAILDAFAEEIHDLAHRGQYRHWDIVALSEQTPGLDALLAKFADVHTHTEDEVRAIVAGSGIFVIMGDDATGFFDVVLAPGDVISVRAHTPHYFTLCEDRCVIAVRLFIEASGWVAIPYAPVAHEGCSS